MAYNVIDLIEKATDIALKRKNKYEEISKGRYSSQSLTVTSKVLIKQIDKTVQYYKNLRAELENTELEEIDFAIYDKMSFLINEFNKKQYVSEISSPRDFFKFSLILEKDVYSLLIDIQGRFVKSENDTNTKTYEILSELINNKARLITTIENALNS